ncbi:MAG: KpsF/GutQ family sugar-phosphate isomerase [Chitinophagales bacterium]|nr:KpsF/GutQ family sugar-phosphate isomerase [Chitinophagales bacterium]
MNNIQEIFREVIALEANAIQALQQQNFEQLEAATNAILQCKGRVIVSGLGKSGIIGKKISATFASTGTPSFFMHTSDALHGDLGMVKSEDILLCISNSGETDEILKLIPALKKNHVVIISFTGNPASTLAKNSNYHFNTHVEKEACPLQLAPTASTVAALVIGDALAVTLMKLRNFKEQDFALFHPGGNLGRKLLRTVADEMLTEPLPQLPLHADIKEIINAIGKWQLGLTVITDEHKNVIGIITDGDLRRAMAKTPQQSFFQLTAKDIMTPNPATTHAQMLLADAEMLMQSLNKNSLLVIENEKLKGVIYQRKIKYE